MRSLIFFTLFAPFFVSARLLEYAPAPVDNPLKGLVPYASEWKKEERFPHSMEFRYFALGEVMMASKEVQLEVDRGFAGEVCGVADEVGCGGEGFTSGSESDERREGFAVCE